MTETVQREPVRDVRMTDCAGILTFASYECDVPLLGVSMSIEPGEDGSAGHVVFQIITATTEDAERVAAHHALTEDPARAARLSLGSKLWSGWISGDEARLPVRCVLYAHTSDVGPA